MPAVPGRLWVQVHRVTRRMSLRARLLLGLIGVAALGLVVADVVVYRQVESFLTAQLDSQLNTTMGPLWHEIEDQLGPSGGFPAGGGGSLAFQQNTPAGAWGAVVWHRPAKIYAGFTPVTSTPLANEPVIPANAVPAAYASSQTVTVAGTTFNALNLTTSAVGTPSFHYRLLVIALPTTGARAAAVVALPLTAVDAALHHLVGIDLLASAAVVGLLAALGYVVVRVGMRPLAEIELTAEQIAAGDLSRRVARADEETEVGRLGASLNAMLGQIEHAFAEQRDSEGRLRQFLADASHELRTPVTSIRGYAELFRRGAASRPEDLAAAMRRIEDESTRMGVLVEDLLLLARLDQGPTLEFTAVNLVEVATNVAADAQVVAPDHPVTLDAPAPVTVRGDPSQLVQVATNLVQNAIRYTPAGTPVTVHVTRSADRAVLAVEDEGPGLAPEHAARVFERFYRADPSRTRGSGGTGLGLSIVKSIAAAHGGRAYVRTEVGRGATFVVELPLLAGGGGSGGEPGEVGGVVERAEDPTVALHDERRDGRIVDGDERERTGAGRVRE